MRTSVTQCFLFAAVTLSGCSATTGFDSPTSRHPAVSEAGRNGSHVLAAVQIANRSGLAAGLYVRDGLNVFGYAANNRKNDGPFCEQKGFGDYTSIAFDRKGLLIGLDNTSDVVTVYKTPRTKNSCGTKLGMFTDPYGSPIDVASLDAAKGVIAVANFKDNSSEIGSIAICTLADGCTAELTNGNMLNPIGITMAKNGDCWVYAFDESDIVYPIYFAGCLGSGQPVTGFNRQFSAGGLDIDANGNLVVINGETSYPYAASVNVYSGCNPVCALLGGPFKLLGNGYFGKVNADATRLAVGDMQYGQIDVYSYSPTSIRYLYSFSNGLLGGSQPLIGVAYNPESKL